MNRRDGLGSSEQRKALAICWLLLALLFLAAMVAMALEKGVLV